MYGSVPMNYQQISTTATSEEPEYRSTVRTLPRQTGKLSGVDGYSMRSTSSSDRAHGLRLGERGKAESINLIFSTRLLSFYSVRRCRRVSVRPTDRRKPVLLYLNSRRLDESTWLLAWRLLPTFR